MDKIDLVNFLAKDGIEKRWEGNLLSCWIWHWDLGEFSAKIPSYLEDEALETKLLSDGSLWFDLVPICEHYEIDPEQILPRPK